MSSDPKETKLGLYFVLKSKRVLQTELLYDRSVVTTEKMRQLRNPKGTHDVMLNLNKCMPHILRTIGIQLSHNQRVLLFLHCEPPYGTYR